MYSKKLCPWQDSVAFHICLHYDGRYDYDNAMHADGAGCVVLYPFAGHKNNSYGMHGFDRNLFPLMLLGLAFPQQYVVAVPLLAARMYCESSSRSKTARRLNYEVICLL